MSSTTSGPPSCPCSICPLGDNQTEDPVRYGDGEVVLDETDLTARGFGFTWGHTRSYGNQLSRNNTGFNGNSWLVAQVEYLAFLAPDLVAVMRGISSSLWLRKVGDTWIGELGAQVTMREVGADLEVYNQRDGVTQVFHAAGAAWYLRGQLKETRNPSGGVAKITRDGQGRITKWEASDGATPVQKAVRFDYAYHETGAGSGRLKSVTKVVTRGGIETNVRRSLYEYYGLGSPNGNFKDLLSFEIQQWDGLAWVSIRKGYYRYYLPGDPNGFAHGLKYQLGPEAVRQMAAAGVDPETAPDLDEGSTLGVAGFADKHFRYDAQRRVTLEQVRGNSLEFSFAYQPSGHADAPNHWKTRTTVTRPDGSQEIVYCNSMLQVILKILKKGDREWYDYRKYDADGRMVLKASSLAIQSYNEASPTLVTLKANEGLIEVSDFYPATNSTTGTARGFLHYRALKEGSEGDEIRQEEFAYESRTVAGQTVFVPKEWTVYNGNSATVATDLAVTSYVYLWYDDKLQPKQVTTVLPVVEDGQHGDGETYSRDQYFDEDGYNTWSRNELGVITRRVFDKSLSMKTQLIEDVQTSGMTGVPSGWATLPGNGKNLVTDFEYDEDGRRVLTLGPAHQADVGGSPTMVRSAEYTVYRDVTDEVWTAKGYATGTAPAYSFATLNPVAIMHWNASAQPTDQILATRSGSGRLSSSDSFPQSSWLKWTSYAYDRHQRPAWQRDYFVIPTSQGDTGINGTNYAQIDYGYDSMDRRNRERSGGGTITRTVFDARVLVVSTWTGTNDTSATDNDPTGGGASGNNMVEIVSNKYDYEGTPGFQQHGNGVLTEQTEHVDGSAQRITSYTYDWRNRRITKTGEEAYFESITYDNRNRITATERKDGSTTGTLLTRDESHFDPLGRVYLKRASLVAGGVVDPDQHLDSDFWYDGAGNVIKSREAGRLAVTKSVYDSLGRLTATFLCHPEDGIDDGDTNDVSNDIVVEQNETEYDDASNVTGTVRLLRFHDTTGTGPLNGPTGSNPKSRNYYTFSWSDAVGREVASANYGTSGGTAPTRPASVPASSASILVDLTAYNAAGLVSSVINAQGIETRTDYDALGRVTKLVEDYVDGIPDGSSDRTTQYVYTLDGLVEMLTLQNSATGAQITRWQYGTTLSDSAVASSRLVRAKIFPDSDDAGNPLSNGGDGIYDRVEYRYNRLGQITASRDQAGTVHEFDYDGRGRQTADRVTTLGTNVDGAVRRIETDYDPLGHVTLVTSYDAATGGTVVNQVEKTYGAFGQLASDAQAHSGTVTGSTPVVGYTRADGASNSVRLIDTIYPDGRSTRVGYGDAGSIDDVLSRVYKVEDVSTSSPWDIATWSYIGADTSVISSYPEPGVELTYLKQGAEPDGPAGDPYAGLDAFGRIIDHRWMKGGADIERLQYGFNRVNMRQWRLDTIAHAADKKQDNYYNYDGLGQVTARDQGQLANDRSGISGTPFHEEDWVYDPSGNWNNYGRKTNGSTTLAQTRTHTKVNEILTYDGSSIPAVFDPCGNMTRIPRQLSGTAYYEASWDAWNRLVRIKTPASGGYGSYSGNALDVKYAYDGLTRRTTREVVTGTAPGITHYYYNEQWKCLEERWNGGTTASKQFVFGARGRNDLVFRDKIGGSPVRQYALCDNMGSKVAITDDTGTIQERYAFSAFGDLEVMDAFYNPRTTSLYDWETLFHGEVRDIETGYYNYGYRYYLPQLGRWPSRDPIGEITFKAANADHFDTDWLKEAQNLYLFAANDPCNLVDLYGLAAPAAGAAALATAINAVLGCLCGLVIDDLCDLMYDVGYAIGSGGVPSDSFKGFDASVKECIIGAIAGAATGPAGAVGITGLTMLACGTLGLADGIRGYGSPGPGPLG